MRFETFDPPADDRRLRACHQLAVASQPVDDPNVQAMPYSKFRRRWAFNFDGDPAVALLVSDDDGRPVGAGLMELPQLDNRQTAFCYLVVSPERRREGIGSALLGYAARQAALHGRTAIASMTRVGSAAIDFAAASGGKRGITDVRRRLTVGPDLPDRLAELRAAAESHAAGYELRSWAGATPPELLDGVVTTFIALNDAPLGELEPLAWTPDRIREGEGRVLAQGARPYYVAAVSPAGEVAALTEVTVHPELQAWGSQGITAVLRHHRGHRLGLLVKIAMMELLSGPEPELKWFTTYNAESNKHMIAVNTAMGFEISDYFAQWRHDVAAAAAPTGAQS